MIKFSTLFKTVAKNFPTALNTANEHDALPHERNRRFWKKAQNWVDHAAAEARKKAEQHARWVKAQAHARWLKAQEHARRVAAEARRRAEQAKAHARRVAAEARRKAEQHARWLKAQARKRAEQAKAHARRVAAAAERKARQLAATARAFVNKIENQFGGFNGVLKAFRIVFFFMTVLRKHRCQHRC